MFFITALLLCLYSNKSEEHKGERAIHQSDQQERNKSGQTIEQKHESVTGNDKCKGHMSSRSDAMYLTVLPPVTSDNIGTDKNAENIVHVDGIPQVIRLL